MTLFAVSALVLVALAAVGLARRRRRLRCRAGAAPRGALIDLFHDECLDYASRVRAAGVPCDLHPVPGMYHGADRFAPAAPSMRAFTDRMTSALRSALA